MERGAWLVDSGSSCLGHLSGGAVVRGKGAKANVLYLPVNYNIVAYIIVLCCNPVASNAQNPLDTFSRSFRVQSTRGSSQLVTDILTVLLATHVKI